MNELLRGVDCACGRPSTDGYASSGACRITCNNVDEVLEILRSKGKHK